MAQLTEVRPSPTWREPKRPVIAQEPPADLDRRAWLGPAIGAVVLTLAWAAYLAPIVIGIAASALQ